MFGNLETMRNLSSYELRFCKVYIKFKNLNFDYILVLAAKERIVLVHVLFFILSSSLHLLSPFQGCKNNLNAKLRADSIKDRIRRGIISAGDLK